MPLHTRTLRCRRVIVPCKPFNDLFDKLDAWRLDVDDSALLLEKALELGWQHVALEVKLGRMLQRAGDSLGELGGVRRRENDLDSGRVAEKNKKV